MEIKEVALYFGVTVVAVVVGSYVKDAIVKHALNK